MASWNGQGIFGQRLGRAARNERFIRHMAASVEMLCLKEAHCGRGNETHLASALGTIHKAFWSSPGDWPGGGIGILVSRRVLYQFDACPQLVVEDGRILLVRLHGSRGRLTAPVCTSATRGGRNAGKTWPRFGPRWRPMLGRTSFWRATSTSPQKSWTRRRPAASCGRRRTRRRAFGRLAFLRCRRSFSRSRRTLHIGVACPNLIASTAAWGCRPSS